MQFIGSYDAISFSNTTAIANQICVFTLTFNNNNTSVVPAYRAKQSAESCLNENTE